jgi:cobalt-zinc-cadmium efflux system membrane fusion protein
MLNIKRLVICFILPAVILFTGCSRKKASDEEQSEKNANSEIVKLNGKQIKEIGLTAETAVYKPFTGYLKVPATVLTNQDNEALVGSLVQGRVKKVFVKVGDYVKAGQVLMYVEGLEIGEIKASYLTAKSNLELKKANFERQKVLFGQKAGAQKTMLEAKSEYEKAQAEFNAADKKIHSIGLSDSDVIDAAGLRAEEHTAGTLRIKAPISGIITERNVVIGQLIESSTNAFRIINTGSVWIDGQVTEKDINKIAPNSTVTFTSSSVPDIEAKGKINYVGQVIDEKSRTMTIRAEFANNNNRLKPQMFGELLVPAAHNYKAILIPSEAIVKFDSKDYVFVRKDAGTFQRRSVKTGSVQKELVEIKEGLTEGEQVVIKGSFYLKSEMMKSQFGGEE